MKNIPYLWGEHKGGREEQTILTYIKAFSIMVITVIVIFIGLLTITSLLSGIIGCDEWAVGLEFNLFKFNSFEIGITNRNYEWDNGDHEQELRIGLVFVTIFFSSFRNSA